MKRRPNVSKLSKTKPDEEDNDNKCDLSRTTKIFKIDNDGQKIELTIVFDDLVYGKDDVLGEGQFGIVYKMFHPPSNTTFAVKSIKAKSLQTNNKEIKVWSELGDSCPYLVKLYGALLADSKIWLLTELMDISLERFYQKVFAMKMSMPELFISKVAHAVVSAISFMKDSESIHRDIKPPNVLLNYKGQIKLCDFGVSGFIKNSVAFTWVGTNNYMAPEKINMNEKGYTIKSDIWSLGISLIEIATGKHPYSHKTSLLGIIDEVTKGPTPKPDSKNYGSELDDFIDKCLVKEPADRASCALLLEHAFIKKYENEQLDLNFLRQIIDANVDDEQTD